MNSQDKKQFAKEFERTINLGKAKAYSNISTERPLSEQELSEFRRLVNSLST